MALRRGAMGRAAEAANEMLSLIAHLDSRSDLLLGTISHALAANFKEHINSLAWLDGPDSAGLPVAAGARRGALWLGGVDGYYTLCGLHYCNLFANPRMNVLFDTRDEDTAASALDHGKRIACTLLDECHGTHSFASLGRGFSGAFAVMGTHNKVRAPRRPPAPAIRARGAPPDARGLRRPSSARCGPSPSGHRKANRRFPVDQRDSWVGSHMMAPPRRAARASAASGGALPTAAPTEASVAGPPSSRRSAASGSP